MQLYDPTVAGPERNYARAAAMPDLSGKTIGVLHNGKLNAQLMLTSIADLFEERHGCKTVPLFSKSNASAPAPAETLQEIAGKVDFIVTGLGD
mgnify:CR=1 FL=1|jgi:hypothetical protein